MAACSRQGLGCEHLLDGEITGVRGVFVDHLGDGVDDVGERDAAGVEGLDALLVRGVVDRRIGGPGGADGADHGGELPGFSVPVHRALTEHILLGGAPRSLAILNGTLAAALGLGLRLWLVGLGLWAVGHFAAVWAAKRDPQFVDVVRKHLRIPGHLSV